VFCGVFSCCLTLGVLNVGQNVFLRFVCSVVVDSAAVLVMMVS